MVCASLVNPNTQLESRMTFLMGEKSRLGVPSWLPGKKKISRTSLYFLLLSAVDMERPVGESTPGFNFNSRRSPIYSRYGCVASSQPLASQVGLSILQKGGNAVDACIAMAAALNVTEPGSTGIGGDCFVLFYDAKTKNVSGLNGSGRSPLGLTIDKARAACNIPEGVNVMPTTSIHTVTVPGAPAGWVDAISKWGTMDLKVYRLSSFFMKLKNDLGARDT